MKKHLNNRFIDRSWLRGRPWPAVCAILALLSPLQVRAEESRGAGIAHVDCRYEQTGRSPSADAPSSGLQGFPANDVFRPLLADPKQPQFFASWQVTEIRSTDDNVNIGAVGIGDNIGLVGRRNGCDGWQVGIFAGVWAQFDMDESSYPLLNADYQVGIPFSWRRGIVSSRVRLLHQSSHLGDELLLSDPSLVRVNLSTEAIDALVSIDVKQWGRLYGGGIYLINPDPDTLDSGGLQFGFELRGATKPGFLSKWLPGFRRTLVAGADFKSWEENHWNIDSSVVGGVEISKEGSDRRLRLLVNYYYGHAPYGQFFTEKIEQIGFGLYSSF
jgi:hypothetical protein